MARVTHWIAKEI